MSVFQLPQVTSPEPVVYVVDDDPLVVRSLRALLLAQRLKVEVFSSAEEFLAAFQPCGCGCLITDLRMQGMSGLELQERLRDLCGSLSVIIVTGHADVGTAVRTLERGAVTLIEKPYESETLLTAVARGLQASRLRFVRQQRLASIQSRFESLSDDERSVMEMMVAGETNKTIALRLQLSMRTVDRRRQRVLDKMQAANATQLAAVVAEYTLAAPASV